MKKNILTLLAVVAAFAFAVPSQAQVKFGVKAGLNLSSINVKDMQANLDGESRTGFFAGVTADVTIPLAGLGADVSLLYDNRLVGISGTEDGETTEANKTLHYIALPINLKYTIGFSSLASVYFATGPQFAWNVGDRNWRTEGTDGFTLKSSTFSWNVGLGVTALSHVRVGYNYNIGLGNTAEWSQSATSAATSTATSAVKGKLKNNTHQISLTYFF